MNLFNKSKKITAENYDKLWEAIEEKLEDLYDNNPDGYDLENYDFRLDGDTLYIDDITMGYDHGYNTGVILKLLVEEGIIKVKDNK